MSRLVASRFNYVLFQQGGWLFILYRTQRERERDRESLSLSHTSTQERECSRVPAFFLPAQTKDAKTCKMWAKTCKMCRFSFWSAVYSAM